MPGWEPDLEELRRIRADAAAIVKETPVLSFGELSRRHGGNVYLKTENLQRTGSFKLRGALAKLRAAGEEARRGVVTGSAGNHAQALAYAARAQGVACTVFMPTGAPLAKVEAVSAFGAEVRQEAESVDACVALARELAAGEGLLFVHPFDDRDVIAGQAGIALELHEQVPDLARVIVPVGGGGLVSGVAGALSLLAPEVSVIGVQASGCLTFGPSIAAGVAREALRPSTIADGIAVKRPGELTLACAARWADGFVGVDDDAIAAAMVLLLERAKLVTEGAGAVGVAALETGVVAPAPDGATVVVLSGGNVDMHLLATLVNRHETDIGRRVRLFTRVSDRPGALAGLLATVAAAGGNVLDVVHVRDGIALSVEETGVEILLEARSREHREELTQALRESGYPVEDWR